MSMDEDEILSRVASGERLRWVPCSMLGIKRRIKGQRVLRLGNITLGDNDGYTVISLENRGRLIANEVDGGICDYVLIDGENKK